MVIVVSNLSMYPLKEALLKQNDQFIIEETL